MLESIPQEDRPLMLRAAHWAPQVELSDLTTTQLSEIVAEEGIDFATAVAYHRVTRDTRHATCIKQISRRIDCVATTEVSAVPKEILVKNAAFGLIPNLGYFDDPKSHQAGTAMLEAARRLGFCVFEIETSSTISLEANALKICEAFEKRTEERLILCSISKGGADVKTALANEARAGAFQRVVAWINVCGLLEGSPIVDRLVQTGDNATVDQIIKWFRGRGEALVRATIENAKELAYAKGSILSNPLMLQKNIFMLNVVAFPLYKHLTYELSRFFHGAIADMGPNDGYGLLADMLSKPGVIFPVWGCDHYLDQTVDVSSLTKAILEYLCTDCRVLERELESNVAVRDGVTSD